MWTKYFAGVRWGEVLCALLLSVLIDLQAKSAQGLPVNQGALYEIAINAVKTIVAYLRVPKGEAPPAPRSLPSTVDPTAAIVAALVGKGLPELTARQWVASNLESAAQFARGGE